MSNAELSGDQNKTPLPRLQKNSISPGRILTEPLDKAAEPLDVSGQTLRRGGKKTTERGNSLDVNQRSKEVNNSPFPKANLPERKSSEKPVTQVGSLLLQ